MKFTELVNERKAIAELVEEIILDWIRFSEMPGHCKETDPYKWYYLASEDGNGGDPNLDVFEGLQVEIKNYLQGYIDDDIYTFIDADEYISKTIQILDEDKYGWWERAQFHEHMAEERLK